MVEHNSITKTEEEYTMPTGDEYLFVFVYKFETFVRLIQFMK